jgi:crotonobetainyl-CoA:carnitine CoA-transferase CaiB-like acyl-CoA transferase
MTAADEPKTTPLALDGLKVLDLTQVLAGPFCTMVLADQGADVVKIEPPTGDLTRELGPFPEGDDQKLLGGYYHSINRNKRGMVLDLKTPGGRKVLERLVIDADVLVENYRAGVMDRLGLSYEYLKTLNPRLVYAAIRGFGDPRSGESPYAEWPAFDVIAQAMGGMMSVTGPDKDTPLKIGPGVGDILPAMMAAFGILAAVRHADKTGDGQFVDVSMYDSILALCERIAYRYSFTGEVSHPEGNAHPLACPFGIFEAKDGWVALAAPNPAFWEILTTSMGRPDLDDNPRYATNQLRTENSDEVIPLVTEWTRSLTKKQIEAKLGGKIPFGPVNNIADIFDDPHPKARGMLTEVGYPGLDKAFAIVDTPIKMSGTPGGIRHRAPLLGEHTQDILNDLGYDTDQIAALKDEGAIL